MKTLISISYTFLLICLFSACQKANEHKTYYENGTLQEVIEMTTDSLRNGVYIRYTDKGIIAEKANYSNGKLNGVRQLYFANSDQIEIEEHYVNDNFQGPYKTFYPSGKIELEATYNNNILEGVSKKYFENGSLQEEVLFENNEENGAFVEYYENGSPEWKGTYRNGANEIGLLENYNENGELVKKMMCSPSPIDSSSVCRTIWTKEKGDIEVDKIFDSEQ